MAVRTVWVFDEKLLDLEDLREETYEELVRKKAKLKSMTVDMSYLDADAQRAADVLHYSRQTEDLSYRQRELADEIEDSEGRLRDMNGLIEMYDVIYDSTDFQRMVKRKVRWVHPFWYPSWTFVSMKYYHGFVPLWALMTGVRYFEKLEGQIGVECLHLHHRRDPIDRVVEMDGVPKFLAWRRDETSESFVLGHWG